MATASSGEILKCTFFANWKTERFCPPQPRYNSCYSATPSGSDNPEDAYEKKQETLSNVSHGALAIKLFFICNLILMLFRIPLVRFNFRHKRIDKRFG